MLVRRDEVVEASVARQFAMLPAGVAEDKYARMDVVSAARYSRDFPPVDGDHFVDAVRY